MPLVEAGKPSGAQCGGDGDCDS
ncbi:unnamed protein product, partial [Rotaria socialis]